MSDGEHLYYSVRQGDVTSESMDVERIQEKFRRWKKLYPDLETEILEVRAFRRRDLEDTLPCACCGKEVPVEKIDSKPTPTLWLRFLRLLRGQLFMLGYAADRGYDFDRHECAECYGPGYAEM